jgi:DNA-binding response OmpR family regulator
MSSDSTSSLLIIGPITIDVERLTVSVGGEPIMLTPTEFSILHALVAVDGRALTRDQLIKQAIGDDVVVTGRTIDVHITSLRGKLGSARDLIQTVRGIGYRIALNDQQASEP